MDALIIVAAIFGVYLLAAAILYGRDLCRRHGDKTAATDRRRGRPAARP